jgi:hypothetical protein
MSGTSKFNLMICELHYKPIHGKTRDSWPTIETHYLAINCFDVQTGRSILDLESEEDEDSDEDDDESVDSVSDLEITIEQSIEFYQTVNPATDARYVPHICIRNYFNIISRPDYIKPEIGLLVKLPTGESVAIIKTIWIKLIQRAWKRAYKRRQFVINGRKQIASLNCVRLTGLWPPMYRFMPTLAGLLVN